MRRRRRNFPGCGHVVHPPSEKKSKKIQKKKDHPQHVALLLPQKGKSFHRTSMTSSNEIPAGDSHHHGNQRETRA